jgi:hypothetical protein
MNKRFDPLLKTLTDINEARQKPAGEEEQRPAENAQSVVTTTAVPTGRTTLKLSKKGGTVEALSVITTPLPPSAVRIQQTAAAPTAVDERPAPADCPADHTAAAVPPPPPPPPEPAISPVNIPETFPTEIDDIISAAYFEPEPPPVQRNETAAALHVRAATRPKKPKPAPMPGDKVLTAYRLEKGLKDAFEKTCRDRGTIPSVMIRNLIKQYCGL